jgi:hypothetical protein
MKLYHHAGSWQLPGKQDRKAARVDVPGAPPELCAWLNARRVPVQGDAFDGLVPLNDAAHELLGEARTQLASDPGAGEQYRLGPVTKDPPRISPAFLGDLAGGAEFVPISKAAEIDRLLARCPKCHGSAEAHVISWATSADRETLQRLAATIAQLADSYDERNGE